MIATFTVTAIAAMLLLLSLLAILANPFLRVPTKRVSAAETSGEGKPERPLPSVSVIVMVRDFAHMLERNLPLLLGQDYAPGFQIILVANEGDSLADDIIKKHENCDALQSTFVPKTSRYISREKLGVTLGVKAAKHEWCLLIDGNCWPESDHWLAAIGAKCTEERNIVIGYCNYSRSAKSSQRFYRLRHFCRLWLESKGGTTYCSNASNLAFRKSEFIEGDGFRGNLDSVRGEYDFIVNKYSRKRASTVATAPAARLTEEAPAKKLRHSRSLFRLHSQKTMKRGFLHMLPSFIDTLLLHLAFVANVAGIAVASLQGEWPLLGAAILALLLLTVCRTLVSRRAVKAFSAKVAAWSIFPLEMLALWRSLADRLRYILANKNDFTCHKQ